MSFLGGKKKAGQLPVMSSEWRFLGLWSQPDCAFELKPQICAKNDELGKICMCRGKLQFLRARRNKGNGGLKLQRSSSELFEKLRPFLVIFPPEALVGAQRLELAPPQMSWGGDLDGFRIRREVLSRS